MMNWKPAIKTTHKKQRELFIEFTPDEKIVVDILQQHDSLQIDELYLKSGLSSSAMAAALLMLEMNSIVTSLPGKLYKIVL
jgi:DNA processing protein